MRRLTLIFILILIAPLAMAETFQGRDYELLDGRKDARPAPLILDLHGAGSTGPRQRRYSGFDRVAAFYNAVVAYPSAPGKRWNDGRWDALGQTDLAARDDVGWLRDLAGELIAQGVADPDRIYAIGHSNGGGMVRRLTCDAPDLLAGAAIVSTTLLIDFNCTGARAMDFLVREGRAGAAFFSGRRVEFEGSIVERAAGKTPIGVR